MNSLQKPAILLVDDQPANLLALEVVLQPLGVEMVRAKSGMEALTLLPEREFACILLDIMMPGIDGFETARRIRQTETLRQIPIIFLTAADLDDSQIVRAYALGAVDFVRKPFVPEIIRSKARVFVELFEQARTLALHASEQATRDSQERLQLLFENVTDVSIFNADPSGKILDWNVGAERIFGWSSHEAVGSHLSVHYTVEDKAAGLPEHSLSRALKEGQYKTEEWRRRKDGARFWADIVVTTLRDVSGDVRGFAYIIRDATDRKLAEEQIATARDQALQASYAKSAFLANMSHELRTPLNAILGYTEMLSEEMESLEEPSLAEDLAKIRLSAEHLLALVNDILDLSRIEAGRLELHSEEVVVEDLIVEVAAMAKPLIERNHNQLQLECRSDHGVIRTDRIRLRQILYNLLSNAAKFTENGNIWVSCCINRQDPERWLELKVKDTGIGIPSEHVAKVFDKFHQADQSMSRKYEGTGLGLAISRLLCDAMGGEIGVESSIGAGSTFVVRLPFELPEQQVPVDAGTRDTQH